MHIYFKVKGTSYACYCMKRSGFHFHFERCCINDGGQIVVVSAMQASFIFPQIPSPLPLSLSLWMSLEGEIKMCHLISAFFIRSKHGCLQRTLGSVKCRSNFALLLLRIIPLAWSLSSSHRQPLQSRTGIFPFEKLQPHKRNLNLTARELENSLFCLW